MRTQGRAEVIEAVVIGALVAIASSLITWGVDAVRSKATPVPQPAPEKPKKKRKRRGN